METNGQVWERNKKGGEEMNLNNRPYINGIRDDNRIENLRLTNRKEHVGNTSKLFKRIEELEIENKRLREENKRLKEGGKNIGGLVRDTTK